MNYFNEIDRMFQNFNADRKLRTDLASRLVDPAVQSLRSSWDHVDRAGKSLESALRQTRLEQQDLASQFRGNLERATSIPLSYRLTWDVGEQFRQQLRFQVAQCDSIMKMVSVPAYRDWSRDLFRASRELMSGYGVVRDLGLDSFAQELKKNVDWFQTIQAAASPVLSMLAGELLDDFVGARLRPALFEGFGAELLGHLAEAELAGSEEEVDNFLQTLLVWLFEHAKRLPGTMLSADALMQIFFTCATLIYSQHMSNESERRINENIRQLEVRVLEQVNEVEVSLIEELRARCSQGSPRNEYVVLEAARLRLGPGTDFEASTVLLPNLIVEEIGREGKWLHVEFFDYVEGEMRQGWVAEELLTERPGD